MATGIHKCGTYPFKSDCVCLDDKGETMSYYKQFNEDTQTYECCNRLNISLKKLRDYNGADAGGEITDTAIEFFKKINSEQMTGCCYVKYITDGNFNENTKVFTENHEPLYNQYLTTTKLYNQFMKDTNNVPTTDTGNVKCENGHFPYILSYKSPDEIYYKNAYVCSQTSNDAFIKLTTGYGLIDYTIKRFYDNSTDEPCLSSTCQLIQGNLGDHANQGNSESVSKNKTKGDKVAGIASLTLGIILLIVFLSVTLYHYNKENRYIESNIRTI